ncbi:MAG: hypothetical protein IJ315_00595 [Firmicutes bacterium]|nr:hypothetical protein [Bacillota bacterium]
MKGKFILILLLIVLLPGCKVKTPQQDFHDRIDKLIELGVTGITNDIVLDVEEWYREQGEFYNPYGYSPVLDVLGWVGMGEYGDDGWILPESNICSISAEVMYVDTMYTDLLRAVSMVSGGEVVFTQVSEDWSGVSLESGHGKVTISFVYEGEVHVLTATATYDWMDFGVLDDVCDILKKDGDDKQLYYISDEVSGVIIFYNTKEWMKEFRGITGFQVYG